KPANPDELAVIDSDSTRRAENWERPTSPRRRAVLPVPSPSPPTTRQTTDRNYSSNSVRHAQISGILQSAQRETNVYDRPDGRIVTVDISSTCPASSCRVPPPTPTRQPGAGRFVSVGLSGSCRVSHPTAISDATLYLVTVYWGQVVLVGCVGL